MLSFNSIKFLNPTEISEKMQNQAAVEALYSATFVEDYLDYVENVPDDLQRHHSRLRELDMSQHQVPDMSKMTHFYNIIHKTRQFKYLS